MLIKWTFSKKSNQITYKMPLELFSEAHRANTVCPFAHVLEINETFFSTFQGVKKSKKKY